MQIIFWKIVILKWLYFWGYMLSINYFSILILKWMRQHSNYLRFKISMDYHLEIIKKGNCRFFFFFCLAEGITS